MLSDQLKTSYSGIAKCVAMLQDNFCLHTVTYTVEILCQLNFEVLKYPLYSSDLAPSDCQLFGSLKDSLRDDHFTSDQELKEVVYVWLVTQPKTFFSEGIKKHVDL
jgi:hypothetical protein